MKKLTLMFAALIASVGMFAKTLYLAPNANWLQYDARFAVYAFGGTGGEAWTSMALVSGQTNVYSATVDETKYPKVIFCRMNPATTENNWDNKWNQTADLTIDATNDLYTITDGDNVWDGEIGTWSVYKTSETPAVEKTYTVVGATALLGVNWNYDEKSNDMTLVDGVYTLVRKGVSLGVDDYEYKVVENRSWDTTYPAENAKLTIAEAAVYDVTFTYKVGDNAPDAKAVKTDAVFVEKYYVAGSMNGWDAAGTELVDGKATLSLEAGEYQFKVTNGTWDKEWNYENIDSECSTAEVTKVGNNNISFTIEKAQDVVIEFNAETNKICVKAEGESETPAGDTKYYVAGSMNGWTVNSADYQLVDGAITLKLEPGKYEFKITDGQWNSDTENNHEFTTLDTECTSEGVTGGNGQNIVFEIATAQDVVITLNGTLVCVKVATGEAPTVYYVAGDEALTGKSWWVDYAGAALVNGEITFKNVAAGAHSFKITDGQWNSDTENNHEFTNLDTECSSKGVTGGNGGNITFETYKVQDITIKMDLTTFAICVTADTEKPAEYVDTYVIAGDEKLLGVSWSGTAEQNKMTVKDGVATLVFDSITLAAGNYDFKVVKNGGQWIPDGEGNNSVLSINEAGAYKVTFTYVIGEAAASAVAVKLGGENPVVVSDYYIMGEFSTWGWDNEGTAEKTAMTLKSEGIYEYVIEKFTAAAMTYQYRLRKGNDWNTYNLPYEGNATYTFTEAGDYKLVFTANVTEHTLNLVATKLGDTPVGDTKYYVAGTMNSWAVNSADYQLVDGKIVLNLEAGEYQFKITNGAWSNAGGTEYTEIDTECSTATLTGGNGANIVFTIAEKQEVTIELTSDMKICVKAKTGEIEDVYVIAGETTITGANWDEYSKENTMTVTDGVATLVKEHVNIATASTYKFKVVRNGSTWIPDGADNDSELKIDEAGVYTITFTYKIGDERASATAKKEAGEVVVKYYVAGSMNDWNPAGTELVDGKATFKLQAGTYEFKITKGDWNWEANFANVDTQCSTIALTEGKDDEGNANGNISFTIAKEQEVVIEYNAEANSICVKAEGETPVVVSDYYIMGEFSTWGWDDAGTAEKTAMTLKSEGIYEYVIEKFTAEAKAYSYKLRQGNSWTDSYQLPAVGNAVYEFTEAGDYKLVFTANVTEHTLNLVATKLGDTPVVVDVDYYLFGYINGANYACEDDYENMGEYKFVDGKLSAKFTQESYVAVKTTNNAAWYMTDGYQGDVTSVVLYNTANLGENADKLKVPADVKVDFTLTVNADATLTLAYTIDSVSSSLEQIEAVLNLNAPMYNVLGQKVNAQYKGIVIQDGKKFLLR